MVYVHPDALRRFAAQLETDVAAKLAAATEALQPAHAIEYANFTNLHVPLAVVYVEAANFHHRDLETKQQTATDFRANLEATAAHWEQAEQASTVNQDGELH